VPADGFYEWRKEGTQRIPYWVHPADGGLLSFAGIWERWSRPGREPRHTFAILTMQASAEVAEIHDRMPVVIAERDRAAWLDGSTDINGALAMVREAPVPRYTLRRVSARVNRPAEDDAGLLDEARD
jgi:putative SOS response-associated peptidase YedK